MLQRTAVDPQPHCDSKWIPSDEKTGNRGRGYKGKWYTPGWPWPFEDGVGVVVGECAYLNGSTTPSSPGDCCNVIFGKVKEAKVRHKGQITSKYSARESVSRACVSGSDSRG